MQTLRRLALSHRSLTGLLLALALSVKLLVPAGFMPAQVDGHLVISMCTGTGPGTMVMATAGKSDTGSSEAGHHGKHEPPCAYSGLSTPSLSAADPLLLAIALLFVMALVLRQAMQLPAVRRAYLRPPLRAPPVLA